LIPATATNLSSATTQATASQTLQMTGPLLPAISFDYGEYAFAQDKRKEMQVCRQSDIIEVRRIDNRGRGGRGVFAMRDISAGTVIETVPVILIPAAQVFGETTEAKRSARISWYVFEWAGVTKRAYVALALGYGSIYNHSYEPNARYTRVPPDLLEFTALSDISAGEEILINYHGEPGDKRPVHFDVH
jgi:uncharacterized protein